MIQLKSVYLARNNNHSLLFHYKYIYMYRIQIPRHYHIMCHPNTKQLMHSEQVHQHSIRDGFIIPCSILKDYSLVKLCLFNLYYFHLIWSFFFSHLTCVSVLQLIENINNPKMSFNIMQMFNNEIHTSYHFLPPATRNTNK